MSRNRLHFNNNDAMPSDCTEKLYKIRPIFETLVEKWKEVYAAREHIAIDKGKKGSSFTYIIKLSQLNMALRFTYWQTSASGNC